MTRNLRLPGEAQDGIYTGYAFTLYELPKAAVF
ncbi:hypothetical protein J2W70_000901 [Pseudomonas koreensis]|nr:hypothetical protein [Pseudomonas koreensis]